MLNSNHRTALQAGHTALYHYEKFSPDYLTAILTSKAIHCSNPSNLNDPWDCKPAFDPHSLDEPDVLEREIAWREEHPAKHRWAERMRNQSQSRVDFINGQSIEMEKVVAKRRIYCLATTGNSTLMWSHYAQNHHGICLEFNTANELFSKAREVRYCKEYPKWVISTINPNVR